jgi:hypothetical protein
MPECPVELILGFAKNRRESTDFYAIECPEGTYGAKYKIEAQIYIA